MTYLVCFTKVDDDGLVQDQQYHVFDKCLHNLEFVHDEIFKFAISRGYSWSSVPFNLDFAYRCDFTISNFCED